MYDEQHVGLFAIVGQKETLLGRKSIRCLDVIRHINDVEEVDPVVIVIY